MAEYRLELDRILTRAEVRTMLTSIREAGGIRNPFTCTELALLRLGVGCGLRRAEIVAARLDDIVDGDRPYLTVKARLKKGRVRRVPLWWDRGTYDDLIAIRDERARHGANGRDPLACTVGRHGHPGGPGYGKRLTRPQTVWTRTLDRLVDSAQMAAPRAADVRIHDLRHTFATFALYAGHSLIDVQRALGHSNIRLTSLYLHALQSERDSREFGSMLEG